MMMALPAIIGFVAFTLAPMIASLFISLTDWTIGAAPQFVGVENYVRMFSADSSFFSSLWATVYYTLGAVPLSIIVAFVVALLLNANVRGQSVFRVIYYIPAIVPIVANSMLWIWLFNPDFGLLNSALARVGLPGSDWIFAEETAVPSLILMATWGFGNIAVIFLAGLQGVPRHLYEAISVDGGGAWSKFRHITLPMMTPVIFYSVVTGVIGALQVFVQAAVMTEGGPNDATLFFVYYLYRTAFTNNEMGYASALAWILFLIIMAITVLLFRNSNKWVYYEAGTGR
ncbi:binding-protein-dependent transport systems inner membrane component [Beutenbergia cavernae DSM 12333]|uniref:Binding-protein-dependent transport systems inner membrane component n=1 Tax=Beutenbergia cavernae (strain ATCC BAA-8 / DSM 12333 / CCUG 43141 / JCM 11478 / NBRC 16432 / NCIMB 13614 / HKI 0122) TaxID=471853 RepID=C5C4B0_BEUC1|nr:binding-protein-dependent transport systems inner membrane component [Beutenbergia cavernae DSM 12333]